MFKNFARVKSIRHITGAHYLPATKGLAGRLVQSFKHDVKADKSNRSVQHKIDRFLLSYRAAPHSTTGLSPAQLPFQRNLKTRLDLIKPNLKRLVDDKLLMNEDKCIFSFHEGESAWIRNYRNGLVGPSSNRLAQCCTQSKLMTRFGEDTWNNSVLIVYLCHHTLRFLTT